MKIEVSPDGSEYIIRIPRQAFVVLGGVPREMRDETQRQAEVLELIRQHKGDKQIAAALSITVRTVKFHVTNLLRLYEVSSRVELAQTLYVVKRSGGEKNAPIAASPVVAFRSAVTGRPCRARGAVSSSASNRSAGG